MEFFIYSQETGEVTNVILVEDLEGALAFPLEEGSLMAPMMDGVAIGATFSDGVVTPIDPPTEALRPLTRRQLRLALRRSGDILETGVKLLPMVEAALNSIPDEDEREEALIEWQDASEYLPDNPLVASLCLALSITEDQMRTLWLAAQKL